MKVDKISWMHFLVAGTILLGTHPDARGQIITPIVVAGEFGDLGDGERATQAALGGQREGAAEGYLYIADTDNRRIRSVWFAATTDSIGVLADLDSVPSADSALTALPELPLPTASIVYGHPLDLANRYPAWTSDRSSVGSGWRSFDNFYLAQPTVITGINWYGIYHDFINSNNNPVVPDTRSWEISFWLDGLEQPAGPVYRQTLPAAEVETTLIDFALFKGDLVPTYQYRAVLPVPFTPDSSTTLWLSIIANSSASTINPEWDWLRGQGGDNRTLQDRFSARTSTVRYGDRSFYLEGHALVAIAFPTILHFGTVALQSAKTLTFTLSNRSDRLFSVKEISPSSSDFVVLSPSFTIVPGAHQEVSVTFKPSVKQGQVATLTIELADSIQPALTISLSGNLGLGDTPWPMRGYDLAHSGRSPNTGPETPQLQWRFDLGSAVFGSPAIGEDGILYVGADNGYIYAIDSRGVSNWRFDAGLPHTASPAIDTGGDLYISTWEGKLYGLRGEGSAKWMFQMGTIPLHSEDDMVSSPALGRDGTLYVGSGDGRLYALAPDDSVKWLFQTEGEIRSSPAIGVDEAIYFGSHDKSIYALEPNGWLRWSYSTEGPISSSPALDRDGTLYIGSGDGRLYALMETGALLWKYQTGEAIVSSPALGADGTVYIGSWDKHIYAIKSTGSLKWKFQTGDLVSSSPAIGADGTIYVGSWDGKIYALSAAGELKWAFQTEGPILSAPTIGADGRLYFGSQDGSLYALGAALLGDFDDSGAIDFEDFFLFVEHFGQTSESESWNANFDLVADGKIDLDDVFRFADLFGGKRLLLR